MLKMAGASVSSTSLDICTSLGFCFLSSGLKHLEMAECDNFLSLKRAAHLRKIQHDSLRQGWEKGVKLGPAGMSILKESFCLHNGRGSYH